MTSAALKVETAQTWSPCERLHKPRRRLLIPNKQLWNHTHQSEGLLQKQSLATTQSLTLPLPSLVSHINSTRQRPEEAGTKQTMADTRHRTKLAGCKRNSISQSLWLGPEQVWESSQRQLSDIHCTSINSIWLIKLELCCPETITTGEQEPRMQGAIFIPLWNSSSWASEWMREKLHEVCFRFKDCCEQPS